MRGGLPSCQIAPFSKKFLWRAWISFFFFPWRERCGTRQAFPQRERRDDLFNQIISLRKLSKKRLCKAFSKFQKAGRTPQKAGRTPQKADSALQCGVL
jgi:hypothetical protein